MCLAECNHLLEELKDVGIGRQAVPVEPGGFVVYVVGIVLAVLGVQKLVSHAEHRGTVGEQQQAAKVLYLLFAKLGDVRGNANISIGSSAIPALLRIASVGDLVV